MSITVSKEEVRGFEKLKAISQIAPIKERIRFFECKYGCSLGEFKNKIKELHEWSKDRVVAVENKILIGRILRSDTAKLK